MRKTDYKLHTKANQVERGNQNCEHQIVVIYNLPQSAEYLTVKTAQLFLSSMRNWKFDKYFLLCFNIPILKGNSIQNLEQGWIQGFS